MLAEITKKSEQAAAGREHQTLALRDQHSPTTPPRGVEVLVFYYTLLMNPIAFLPKLVNKQCSEKTYAILLFIFVD